jgi:hypothetical protein
LKEKNSSLRLLNSASQFVLTVTNILVFVLFGNLVKHHPEYFGPMFNKGLLHNKTLEYMGEGVVLWDECKTHILLSLIIYVRYIETLIRVCEFDKRRKIAEKSDPAIGGTP